MSGPRGSSSPFDTGGGTSPERADNVIKPIPRSRRLKASAWVYFLQIHRAHQISREKIPNKDVLKFRYRVEKLPNSVCAIEINEEHQEIQVISERKNNGELPDGIPTVEETTFITPVSPAQSSVGKTSSKGRGSTPFQSPSSPHKRLTGWRSPDEKSSPQRTSEEIKDRGQIEGAKVLPENSSGKMSAMSSSVEAQSAISACDSKSHRDKIRERIQAAKERVAATAQLKAARHSKVKSPTNHKSEVDQEEAEVNEALKRHQELRAKWRHVASASVEVKQIVFHQLISLELAAISPNPEEE
ncbi:hypothetical protein AAG570_013618 [Ranatra chinensis]|uniref:Uncharacterized protein n=1 Tax=Ranatra chinensis TaxID=642074 RepID=A0ABD0YPC1_9HEMI